MHNLVNVLLYNSLDPTFLSAENAEINVDFSSENATLPPIPTPKLSKIQ